MGFFIVTMTHPAGEGWGRHIAAHVAYLEALVARGVLVASGPLPERAPRAGFLIFKATARADVEALVAADPFATERLIETLSIDAWDPVFGAFAAQSSGRLPGRS